MSAFGQRMEAVARALLGKPNAQLSSARELRYGTHGSLSIDLEKGVWRDHEADQGGGVPDLIARETGRRNGSAIDWMREHGIPVEAEPAPQARKIVATFDYVDELGNLLFQVVRYEPKDFRQRRPGPNGEWVWSVPRRAPRTGADVMILPDNDAPGRKHRDQVVANLAGVARLVRSLDLPHLKPKNDIVDWLAAGGSAEQLYELAERYGRLPHEQPPASAFGALWLHELTGRRDATDWIVKRAVPANAFGALVGEPGCGKSFLALDLAFTVSTIALMNGDARWFGRTVRPGGTVYIAAQGQRGFIKRIQALTREHGVPRDVFPFVLLPTSVDLKAGDGDTAGLIQEIHAHAARMRVPLRLIIVDTLNRALAGGDENSSEDMGAFIKNVEKIKEAVQATVIAVHHKNASGTRERGHSSLRGALDFLIEVERGEVGRNVWRITKQKDEEDGQAFNFTLQAVMVWVDDDGDEITSCVVKPSEASLMPRGGRDRRLPPQAIVAWRILIELCGDAGQRVPISGIDASGVLVTAWRDKCRHNHLVAPGSGDDAFRKAFQRAMDTLRAERRIGIEGDWVWPLLRRGNTG